MFKRVVARRAATARVSNVDFDNPEIHTNTIEGAFSIFKRGMKGVFQHCAKKQLHRYVAEFGFRYTNCIATGLSDADPAMFRGVVGKRLTYQSTRIGARRPWRRRRPE
ncbi:MAG: transposase [Novosphingobium sp.]